MAQTRLAEPRLVDGRREPWSHSRLKAFEECPLKFKFKYIDKLEAAVEQSVEAFLGSMVHKTLEKLYTDLKYQKRLTLEELLAHYRELWKRNWNSEILIVRPEYAPSNYEAMGEQFLRDYWKRYSPFDQAKIIGLEQKVFITLDGGYKLQGYIDRLASPQDGIYEIHDYKTSASLPLEQYLREDRQLALYALAVRAGYQDAKRIVLVWHFLAADKEVVLEKTESELEQLKRDTIALIQRIEAEREFKPRVSRLCDWCEFRPACPEWRHLARAEQLPANEYLNEPGVKLVNRYAELKAQEERLAAELEQVKSALIAYAEREQLTTIAGSDTLAKLWQKECLSFPKRGGPDYDELVAFLKKAGKWDEVSALDAWKLEKIIEQANWPTELAQKVLGFAVTELRQRVYLKQMPSSA